MRLTGDQSVCEVCGAHPEHPEVGPVETEEVGGRTWELCRVCVEEVGAP